MIKSLVEYFLLVGIEPTFHWVRVNWVYPERLIPVCPEWINIKDQNTIIQSANIY